MKRPGLLYALLIGAIAVPTLVLPAQTTPDTTRPQAQPPLSDSYMYGWQLMTPAERDAMRQKMFAAKTFEEREQLRQEHHAQMVARAKERGITLPSEPMMRGGRRGMGMGGGMGMMR